MLWYEIKTHSKVYYAARHFFKMIEMFRKLPKNLKKIVEQYLKPQLLFCSCRKCIINHAYGLLLEIRELAVQRINSGQRIK